MPGLVVGADYTSHLARGYWPSYNVAFFKDIYIGLGYDIIDRKQGWEVGTYYQRCPRAKIFRRDQWQVNSMDKLKWFLRMNNYL